LNVRDLLKRYTESHREKLARSRDVAPLAIRPICSANSQNIIHRQPSEGMAFTWSATLSSFREHVADVLELRSEKQMRGPDTARIVTARAVVADT
jgi:hypothetical protein